MWLLSSFTGTVFLVLATRIWALAGILCFHLAYILDGVDGEVARCKKIFSQEGEYLDKLQHYFVDMLIFSGINIGAFRATSNEIFLFLIPLACIGTVGNHLVYDIAYKIIHLKRFGKGVPERSKWNRVADDIFHGPIPSFSKTKYEKQRPRGMKRRVITTLRLLPHLGYLYELDAILVLTLLAVILDLVIAPPVLKSRHLTFLHLLGIFYSIALSLVFGLRLYFLLKEKMMSRWLECLEKADRD
jgi:hypothetical protein